MEKVKLHKHTGIDAPRIETNDLLVDSRGANNILQGSTLFFETVSSEPTNPATSFLDQVKIYVSGLTILLYVYDFTNETWQKFNYYE